MPDRSGKRRPADLNRLATSMVEDATDEDELASPDEGRTRPPCCCWVGAVGRSAARASGKLTPEQRSEIARKGSCGSVEPT